MTPEQDHDLLIKIDANLTEFMKTMNTHSQILIELQNDRTQNQVNIAHLQGDVKELRTKSNLWDGINTALGLVLAAIVSFFQVTNNR